MTSPPSPQPAELARVVRDARDALGLSQTELANATHGQVSYSYVRLIESGKRGDGRELRVSAPVARALAAALALDEQLVLALAGHPYDPAASQHQLNAAVAGLPPHVRNAVVTIAQALNAEAQAQSARKNEAAA
jgi:transcriptional regulator with XRE-family HTH domain